MVKEKENEFIILKPVRDMKETIKMIKEMDKEFIIIKEEIEKFKII